MVDQLESSIARQTSEGMTHEKMGAPDVPQRGIVPVLLIAAWCFAIWYFGWDYGGELVLRSDAVLPYIIKPFILL
jgi:hypothetical protein